MQIVAKLNIIFTKKDKFSILGLLLMIFIGSLLELLGVSIILPIVNLIMDENCLNENSFMALIYSCFNFDSLKNFFLFLIFTVIFIYIIKNTFLIFMNKCLFAFIYSSQEDMALRLLKSYMKEPYLYHLSKNTAVLQRSINNDVIYFYVVMLHILQLIVEILVCVVLGIYLAKTNFLITVSVLFMAVLCIGTFYALTQKESKTIGKENQEHSGKMIQWVNQSIGGIKEVKLLQREEFFVNKYDYHYKKFAKGTQKYYMIQAVPKYVIEAACITGLMLTLVVEVMRNVDLLSLIPQMTIFVVAAFRILPSVSKISTHISTILFYRPSVDLVYEDLKNIKTKIGNNRQVLDSKIIFNNRLEINNLKYNYPRSNEKVIDGISFQIKKGESVAIIGKSGAGKTTLIDLILGLLEPTEGEICVDGINIYENKEAWYRKLAYIPQSIFLMDDTILNNVAFGIDEEKINIEKVNKAVKQAQLEPFINTLSKGLATVIGEDGARISGGQRQRIGIARALYNEPDILVLDEATSALDAETEKAVMESIDNLKGIKTMIIIAHRLSTIQKCDRIFEIKKGKLNVKK